MALTRKPSRNRQTPSIHEIPATPPSPPRDVLERFPSMAKYHEEAANDRESMKLAINRAIETQQSDLNAINKQVSAMQASIASLQALIAELDVPESGGSSVSNPAPDNSAQVNFIQSNLNDHIQSTVAHGAIGRVVGTLNEQNLEKKTIGFADPRQARFVMAMSHSRIASSEYVFIPEGYQSVIAGPLDVDGNLVVDGVLAVL